MPADSPPEDRQLLQLQEKSRQCQLLAAELQARAQTMASNVEAHRQSLDDAVRQLGRARALLASLAEDSAKARRAMVRGAVPAAADVERQVIARTAQLRRLAAELEVAEDRERRKLARDLHDDLGQTLAALRLRLATLHADPRPDVREAAGELDRMVQSADQATRSLARELAPALLQERGLMPALEWLADDMKQRFGLSVVIDDDRRPKPLSPASLSIVYRAVRELLINVAKHAGVDHADLRLRASRGRLTIQVNDLGKNFKPAPRPGTPGGLGLVSVRERLSFLGGRFSIVHHRGDGTSAEMTLPLEPAEAPAATPD